MSTVHSVMEWAVYTLPLINSSVMWSGKMFQILWKAQTPNTNQRYSDRFRVQWRLACATAVAMASTFFAFLWRHVEPEPITGRLRLILLDNATVTRWTDRGSSKVLAHYKQKLLEPEHPKHRKIVDMVDRLMVAVAATGARECPRIDLSQWTVAVVEDSKENAFSMANGQLLFHTGVLGDDHQTAFIVGHEMAHCAHQHCNEIHSMNLACRLGLLVPVFFTWASLPVIWAAFTHLAMVLVAQICVLLPLARVIEIEADRHGLMLAANLGLNPVEVCRSRAKKATKSDNLSWLSTHPTDKARFRYLVDLIPIATAVWKSAGFRADF